MVTSQKISEKIMGYRGSKSITVLHAPTSQISGIVKEQRVDGSCIVPTMLRCTLMGFERNYQIRVPSKELHKKEIRFYSTTRNLKNETSLNP